MNTASSTLPSPINNAIKKSWEKIVANVFSKTKAGQVTVFYPGGSQKIYAGALPGPIAELHWHNPAMARKVLQRGALGFGESYVDGDWTTPDLTKLLYFFLYNFDDQQAARQQFAGQKLLQWVARLQHWRRRNTKQNSKKNIMAHYDLGNEFYQLWLDESMTYSSGLFHDATEPLPIAQKRKNQRLLEQLEAEPGSHILEIGCGWGGFMEHAAKAGHQVTGVTISEEQFQYATERLKPHPKANVVLQDYRDITGRFDHVVSVEMVEAVGEQYWGTYFRKIKEVLKPGGHAVLQAITMDEAQHDSYRRKMDFIQAHVFPGGFLPTVINLREQGQAAYLQMDEPFGFGHDYANTLKRWRERFVDQWLSIQALPSNDKPFDARFKRLWEYYLAYCEAGFISGRIDVKHVRFRHKTTSHN